MDTYGIKRTCNIDTSLKGSSEKGQTTSLNAWDLVKRKKLISNALGGLSIINDIIALETNSNSFW